MTRHQQPHPAGQFALFDDDHTTATLDTARRPGFVVSGPADAVYRRTDDTDRTGRVETVDACQADTVHHLLAVHRLALGDQVRITDPETAEPRPATLVHPADTTAANPRTPVRLLVDVVRPGLGLVTCADGDFSGSIVRQDGGYLVETEAGEVIGRASSYRAGAARLARHHGHRPGPVEIEHEKDVYG